MMKFFRKHKKAVSPVIAVMLLVAVAVAAVGAYFIWFRSFQQGAQEDVREVASETLGRAVQLVSVDNDSNTYYVVLKNSMTSTVTIDGPVTMTGVTAATIVDTAGASMDIAAGASKSFKITVTTPTGFTTVRGTNRTFTVTYGDGAVVFSHVDA